MQKEPLPRNELIPWVLDILEQFAYFERVRKLCCEDCKSEYGVIEKKSDDVTEFAICPACGGSLDVHILGTPDFAIRGNITTLGQLAEHNTKKMGKYGKEERDRQQKESNKAARKELGVPDKDKMDRVNKINKMTPAQKERYIATGEGL